MLLKENVCEGCHVCIRLDGFLEYILVQTIDLLNDRTVFTYYVEGAHLRIRHRN